MITMGILAGLEPALIWPIVSLIGRPPPNGRSALTRRPVYVWSCATETSSFRATPCLSCGAMGCHNGLFVASHSTVPENRFSTSQGFLYAGGNLILVFSTWGVGRLRDIFGRCGTLPQCGLD